MIVVPTWSWIVAGAVLGAVAGSFLATLVLRWPAGRTLAGRSRCDGCGRALAAWELVPLASYVAQRGRCRSCGAAIDPRHVAIEAAAAAIGAVALALAPGPVGFAGALFGWMLVALAVLDVEHLWLPDRLTAPLAVLGLATSLLGGPPPLPDRLIGAVAGWAALAAVGWGYRRLRRRVGLGGGDPKLLGAIGAWLGWAALPFVLLGASAIGLLHVISRAARGRHVGAADKLPLGALLAAAAWAIWCLGALGILPAAAATLR